MEQNPTQPPPPPPVKVETLVWKLNIATLWIALILVSALMSMSAQSFLGALINSSITIMMTVIGGILWNYFNAGCCVNVWFLRLAEYATFAIAGVYLYHQKQSTVASEASYALFVLLTPVIEYFFIIIMCRAGQSGVFAVSVLIASGAVYVINMVMLAQLRDGFAQNSRRYVRWALSGSAILFTHTFFLMFGMIGFWLSVVGVVWNCVCAYHTIWWINAHVLRVKQLKDMLHQGQNNQLQFSAPKELSGEQNKQDPDEPNFCMDIFNLRYFSMFQAILRRHKEQVFGQKLDIV